MALNIVERDIRAAVDRYSDSELRKKMGQTYLHDIRISSENASVAFQQGVVNVMEGMKFTQEEMNQINQSYNSTSNWKNIVNKLFGQMSRMSTVVETNHEIRSFRQFYKLGVASSRGIFLLKGSTKDRIIIRLYNNSSEYKGTGLTKFNKELRKVAWTLWKETYLKGVNTSEGAKLQNISLESRLPPKSPKSKTGTSVASAFGRGTPFAHDSETAVGTFGLEELEQDLRSNQDFTAALGALQTYGISVDVVKSVKQSLDLTFEKQIIVMPDGTEQEVRVVKGSIRKQGKEPGDWTNIKQDILGSKSNKKEGSLAKFLDSANAKIRALDPATAADAEASEPYSKRAGKRAAERIVKAALKAEGAKRTKGKAPKKAKPGTQSTKIKMSTGLSTVAKAQILTIAGGAKLSARKGRSKSKEEKGGSLSLPKLRTNINRSLGAEIRRNMGKPALTNRTGEFSNSAEVLNLRDTGRTITGEYTYTLTGGGKSSNRSQVYSTFENSGKWPSGYNPKPLIAKSIRNLALRYTERKFTLRRV